MKSILFLPLSGLLLVFLTACSSSKSIKSTSEDECFDVNYHRVPCVSKLFK